MMSQAFAPQSDAAAGAITDYDETELATQIVAKLCHDFISPAGAMSSALDLMTDPDSADMHADALNLMQQSAARMVALVRFARVAYGAATSNQNFSSDELRTTVTDLLAGGRAAIEWQIPEGDYAKPHARILVNLAYVAVGALPTGGTATLSAERTDGHLILTTVSEGPRARLKPEAVQGLSGAELTDGLPGQWIQPHWLWRSVRGQGGTLQVSTDENRVELVARLPLSTNG
ncbi:MAG: histidine phosphotransferase family protein [Brevundimonas sp.]|uniref:histidine phosphotransferase ChpT n=1 Tax=Brevundimonas sp. TaxID=1871086 RepID=UPI002736822D|nr:histidine phosphotransferase family protein [Brevundimonas sp.]MDP3378771.1 histidine phosphotransferase family protein [Brevundimonas sp.]